MKRDYQEVIDAMSNGEYTAEEIKSRIRSYLNNPASKIEGSFAMDSIQAVAQEMPILIYIGQSRFQALETLDVFLYGMELGLSRL